MRIRASKKVFKCVFTQLTCLIIYMFLSSVYIVHALCMVTIHTACSNDDIEVGSDSRQVPQLEFTRSTNAFERSINLVKGA